MSLNGNNVTISSLTTNANVGTPVVQNGNATPAMLTVSNSAANTFAGTLQNGPGGGTLGLTMAGSGTLTLSGNNTFSGGLTIQQGTLQVATINNDGTTGALGNNTSVTLDTGLQSGTLEYTGATAASTMPFTVTPGNGPFVNAAFQIDSALTNLTLSGVIGGSGGFAKTGAGTLTLAGNNTFTGFVTISSGTLQVGSAERTRIRTFSSGSVEAAGR